jgi:hypothetical protein
MAKQRPDPTPIEPREFRSIDEIDAGISKLERRIQDLKQLDVAAAVLNDSGAEGGILVSPIGMQEGAKKLRAQKTS